MPTIKQTETHFSTMLAPSSKAISRRAWGIDVETFWVPVFTAAKAMGQALDLPDEALGAPLRLAKSKDGSVRFGTNGRPVFRLAGDLNAYVTRARENYVAANLEYVGIVQTERPDAYKEQVERQHRLGEPLRQSDLNDLTEAIELMAQQPTIPSDNHNVAVAS